MDAIQLRGLRVMGTHGVLAEEQVRPQPFEVDLDVEADLREAGEHDDLAATLDYGEIVGVVAAVVAGPPVQLLETLAARVAEAVLADGRARSVTVTVRKLRPPVPLDLRSAGVRVTRARRAD